MSNQTKPQYPPDAFLLVCEHCGYETWRLEALWDHERIEHPDIWAEEQAALDEMAETRARALDESLGQHLG